ncbi:hypothetical protein ACQEVZ_31525 [Dactylosporangium sp. CA-152071]|uniref:hypothetical protein n=1 Tax=Dactylosporangium sp. CA-152071 TaxID=3239933 RepID=UPI003D8E5CEE
MSFVQSRFARVAGAGTAAATALSAAALVATPMAAHAAPAATSITIASPAGGKVAADTDKQVVIINVVGLTGATLDENSVESVDLGADTDCQGLDFYIVTGTTQIATKTPTGGCAPTSGVASETIAINFANSGGTLTKALSGLVFIAPPKLDTTAPVITDLSSALQSADQIQQFLSTGGQTIRVKADNDFTFSGANGVLSASLGGKPLTEVKVWKKTDGTQMTTAPSGTTENGNWFTGKTAAGMTNGNLSITHNGVTKTWSATDLGTSVVTVPVLTAMTPNIGKINTATSVTLTGTFTGATGVNFCGVAGTNFVLNTAGTSITVKTPTSGLADDPAGLGTGNFSGVCPVKVVAPAGSNIHTANSVFSFVAE